MRVTMAELNKNVNSIINRAHSSGETITILKHGKPIARILPIDDRSSVEESLRYLIAVEPVEVPESVELVIDLGRKRGL